MKITVRPEDLVTEVRFRIHDNRQLAMFDIDDGEALRAGPVYLRLMGQGVSDRLVRQWIQAHGEAAVAAKLDYVSGQANVCSPVGYLRVVLDGTGPGAGEGAAKPTVPPAPSPETLAAGWKRPRRNAT